MRLSRRLTALLLMLGCLAILTQGIASVSMACHCLQQDDAPAGMMDSMTGHSANHGEHDCCPEGQKLESVSSAQGCDVCDCHMALSAIEPMPFSGAPAPLAAAATLPLVSPSLIAARPESHYRPPIILAF